MNKLLIALLITGLSGPALAGSGDIDGIWLVARQDSGQSRQQEQETRKAKRPAPKKEEQAEREREERGYGYGYERRNAERYYDDRGRR